MYSCSGMLRSRPSMKLVMLRRSKRLDSQVIVGFITIYKVIKVPTGGEKQHLSKVTVASDVAPVYDDLEHEHQVAEDAKQDFSRHE